MGPKPDPRPVRFTAPRHYRGRDARKQEEQRQLHQAAKTLEVYVNERRHPTREITLIHSTIAAETGIDVDWVESILTQAGGGNNGIILAPTGIPTTAAELKHQGAAIVNVTP